MMNRYFLILITLGQSAAFSQPIDPYKFLATLKFDNLYLDYFTNKNEQMFPIRFDFNITQDGNGDSIIDVEDACQNIVQYAIGDSIYGTGRTGLTNRGPNDQLPSIYFHFLKRPEYDVYEYWLYYADNDYLNDHEHDWEKYFVYVQDSTPVYAMISNHNNFNLFAWTDLPKDDEHAVIGVDGGSHAMGNNNQTGVKIRYNGEVSKNSGKLDFGDGQIFPWRIFSNDSNILGVINYTQSPDNFYHGDPVYPDIPELSSSNEYGEPSSSPWNRSEWNDPPSVPMNIFSKFSENEIRIFPNPNDGNFVIQITDPEGSGLFTDCKLEIYNVLGEVIYSEKIQQKKSKIQNVNFHQGIYFYELSNKKSVLKKGKVWFF